MDTSLPRIVPFSSKVKSKPNTKYKKMSTKEHSSHPKTFPTPIDSSSELDVSVKKSKQEKLFNKIILKMNSPLQSPNGPVLRSYLGKIDLSVLTSNEDKLNLADRFLLSVGDDKTYQVEKTRQQFYDPKKYTWIGKVDDQEGVHNVNDVILTITNKTIFGEIYLDNQIIEISSQIGQNLIAINHMDTTKFGKPSPELDDEDRCKNNDCNMISKPDYPPVKPAIIQRLNQLGTELKAGNKKDVLKKFKDIQVMLDK